MPIIAFGLRRAIYLKLIPKAFKSGMSANSFIHQMRLKGLGRRRPLMLSDWRTVNEIEVKKDVLKYIRKDRLPSPRLMAELPWKYSKEYVYKANTWSRTHPDELFTERTVTLLSDKPLTSRQIEEQITTKWKGWEYVPEKLEKVTATSVYRMVDSPLETGE